MHCLKITSGNYPNPRTNKQVNRLRSTVRNQLKVVQTVPNVINKNFGIQMLRRLLPVFTTKQRFTVVGFFIMLMSGVLLRKFKDTFFRQKMIDT